MVIKCIEGTCKHNIAGACGYHGAYIRTLPRKYGESEILCSVYEYNGLQYCKGCSPIRESTDPHDIVRFLNISSPRQIKMAAGHSYCFECGRKLDMGETK